MSEGALICGDDVADDLPSVPLYHHLALSIYWLSNTIMWGVLLHVALQSRLSEWFPETTVGYYFGFLGIVGGIIGTLTQIIVGAFSDRAMFKMGRRRPFVIVGSAGIAIALMLLGGSHSFWPFAASLFVLQFMSNGALGPFTALLPDTVPPREHGKSSGFMGVARLLGDAGGMILGGILLNAGERKGADAVAFHDQRMVVMCAFIAAFTILTVIYTCIAIRERPLTQRPDIKVLDVLKKSFQIDMKGNPDFFWLSASRAVTNLALYTFLESLLLFLKNTLHVGEPEKATMTVMLPAILAAAASSIPSGILSDRIGRKRLVFVAQGLLAFGALGFFLCNSVTWAVVVGIPTGLGFGVFTAVEWAFACNLLRKEDAARDLGLWNASAVVPQIVAFMLAGAIGSGLANVKPGLGWRVDFGLCVVYALAGSYLLRYVHERKTEDAPAPAVAE